MQQASTTVLLHARGFNLFLARLRGEASNTAPTAQSNPATVLLESWGIRRYWFLVGHVSKALRSASTSAAYLSLHLRQSSAPTARSDMKLSSRGRYIRLRLRTGLDSNPPVLERTHQPIMIQCIRLGRDAIVLNTAAPGSFRARRHDVLAPLSAVFTFLCRALAGQDRLVRSWVAPRCSDMQDKIQNPVLVWER